VKPLEKPTEFADTLAGSFRFQQFLPQIRLMDELLGDDIRHQRGFVGLIKESHPRETRTAPAHA
jgi:hypothetical protein